MEEPIEDAIVRITDDKGLVYGAGFLISETYVLTCAHVVAKALGLSETASNPQDTENPVRVDFPKLGSGLYYPIIKAWIPLQPSGEGDIAILEFINAVNRNAKPIRISQARNINSHEFLSLGFPPNNRDGQWVKGTIYSSSDARWLDVKTNIGNFLEPGFSGAPVWDATDDSVIGMAAVINANGFYKEKIIPIDYICEKWPEMRHIIGKINVPSSNYPPWSKILIGHKGSINSIAISSDNKYIISGSSDHTINIWDRETGRKLNTLDENGSVHSVSISPEHPLLLSVSYYLGEEHLENSSLDKSSLDSPSHVINVSYWNLESFKKEKEFILTERRSILPSTISLVQGKNVIVFATKDFEIFKWNWQKNIESHLGNHNDQINSIIAANDGRYVISVSSDRSLKIWDIEEKSDVIIIGNYPGPVTTSIFNLDRNLIISASYHVRSPRLGKSRIGSYDYNTVIQFNDLSKGEKLFVIESEIHPVRVLALATEKVLISGSEDGIITFWDIDSRKKLIAFNGHVGSINAIAITKDSKYLVSGSSDDTLKIWNLSEKISELRKIQGTAYSEYELYDDQKLTSKNFGSLIGASCDVPSSKDQLNFELYAQAFTDLIISPSTDTPLTIGIYGSWGVGKSTLMNQIIGKISKMSEIRTIEFNAWEYNANKEIWPGLVRKIITSIGNDLASSSLSYSLIKLQIPSYRKYISKKLSYIFIPLAIIALITLFIFGKYSFDLNSIISAILAISLTSLLTLIGKLIGVLNNPLNGWITTLFEDNQYGKKISYMEDIQDDLKAIQKYSNKSKRVNSQISEHDIFWNINKDEIKKWNTDINSVGKIVIFIDDLDRCEPNKAVEMLKAVNLLLKFKTFIIF